MNLIERLRARLGAKVVDEAISEELKAKTTDEDKKDDGEKKDKPAMDASAYDELKKGMDEMMKKLDALGSKGTDEDKSDKKDDEKAKDEEGESKSIEDRLSALEQAVAKLLEKKSEKAGDEDEDDDGEEAEDEDKSDGEEGSTMTGDTAARVEVLSPGLKQKKGETEDKLKARALDAAYGTKDGKEVIDQFTGGKKPVLDSAEKINTLFIATSECLKASRGTGLEKTKDSRNFKAGEGMPEGPMTPEMQNELNARFWAEQKKGN